MERIPERDWKTFKRLREVALERLSQRVLEECGRICSDTEETPHERYRKLIRTVESRRDDMARAFGDLRRSTAVLRLAQMNALELLRESELAQLTEKTRGRLHPEPWEDNVGNSDFG